jgi:hypothetical protein
MTCAERLASTGPESVLLTRQVLWLSDSKCVSNSLQCQHSQGFTECAGMSHAMCIW